MRTPQNDADAPPPSPTPPAARRCPVCDSLIRSRRPEATYCSGRCRVRACRQRQRADLEARLERAEAALAEATVAIAELRATVVGGKGTEA